MGEALCRHRASDIWLFRPRRSLLLMSDRCARGPASGSTGGHDRCALQMGPGHLLLAPDHRCSPPPWAAARPRARPRPCWPAGRPARREPPARTPSGLRPTGRHMARAARLVRTGTPPSRTGGDAQPASPPGTPLPAAVPPPAGPGSLNDEPGPATGRSGAYPGGTFTRSPGPACRSQHAVNVRSSPSRVNEAPQPTWQRARCRRCRGP
jgi:hypothetical protein